MQRILSGFGITGNQVMAVSGCRVALPAAFAASARASAAMADFRSGNLSRRIAPRSATSLPSMRPQLVAPLILKLANFMECPWEYEAGFSLSHAATAGNAKRPQKSADQVHRDGRVRPRC